MQPPNPDTRTPNLKAPPGACDTHLHVYGPFDRYQLVAERNYDPNPHSTLDDYLKVHVTLGLERAVIVPGSADMVDVIRAIIQTRPDHVIWGSNWPHGGVRVPMPNDGDLLGFLLAAAPDDETRKLILVGNSAKLYGWPANRT